MQTPRIISGKLQRSDTTMPRRGWRRLVVPALGYAAVLLLCYVVMLPLGWMLTVALKPDGVPVFTTPTEWFPTRYWHWATFTTALTNPSRPFLLYTWNTLQTAPPLAVAARGLLPPLPF